MPPSRRIRPRRRAALLRCLRRRDETAASGSHGSRRAADRRSTSPGALDRGPRPPTLGACCRSRCRGRARRARSGRGTTRDRERSRSRSGAQVAAWRWRLSPQRRVGRIDRAAVVAQARLAVARQQQRARRGRRRRRAAPPACAGAIASDVPTMQPTMIVEAARRRGIGQRQRLGQAAGLVELDVDRVVLAGERGRDRCARVADSSAQTGIGRGTLRQRAVVRRPAAAARSARRRARRSTRHEPAVRCSGVQRLVGIDDQPRRRRACGAPPAPARRRRRRSSFSLSSGRLALRRAPPRPSLRACRGSACRR